MLVRPQVNHGSAAVHREVLPGDILAGGESKLAGANATVGNGTWSGAQIATGYIKRSGSGAAYTDTTDTATAIIKALQGNDQGIDVVPGTTFRLIVANTVAFALTFAAGTGVKTGDGTLDIAASKVREYLVTILNATPTVVINSSTTNASKTITFDAAVPLGTITPGMTVSGAGITAGTRVLGITTGPAGITGVTTDTNSTATADPVAITFGPTVQFDAIRLSDL